MTFNDILTSFILIFRALYCRYAFFSFLGSPCLVMISYLIADHLAGVREARSGASLGITLKDVICLDYC